MLFSRSLRRVQAGRRFRKVTADSSTVRSLSTKVEWFNPTDEHRILRSQIRDFAENRVEPQAKEFNRDERFNMDLYRELGGLGMLGLTVGEEYGGAGADALASCIVHEELSAVDPAFCLSYLAHSLLFTNNLFFNGTDEQKERFLPDACSGKRIGGMCMSEPSHGTDVLGMQTVAKKNSKGGWTLNGQKMWITNGCVDDETLGDMFLVYARTAGEDVHATQAISLFLVEKGMPGFSLGTRIKDKCGMRASSTAELVFEDVEIPPENLVGEEGGAVLCMMRNLEIERVALAAMSCGIAKRSIEMMNSYANERKAFGQPIMEFGQIQRYIANSYAQFMSGRSFLYNVASEMELDQAGNRLDTDAVKLYCTEMGKNVADNAMQVLGGNGYIGDYVVERLWRDSKLLEIGGGTLESHQKNMVRDLKRLSKIE